MAPASPMIPDAPGAGLGRRRRILFVVGAVALVALASCGAIRAQVDLSSRLRRAGFDNVKVRTDETNGFSTVTVEAKRSGSSSDAQNEAAQVVWTKFPRRVDAVVVNIDGNEQRYTRSEMTNRFGPRPARLDDKSIADDVRSIGIGVIIALAIGGLVCVGLIVLIVLLVRNSRRKRRAAGPMYPGYPGGPGYAGGPGSPDPPPGYQPPGYQPPGYQPPGYQPPGYPPPTPPPGDASNYPPPP